MRSTQTQHNKSTARNALGKRSGSHEEVLEHLGALFTFEKKVACITGAAGGVGRAAALGFAK